jgi:GntR family transcriptional regulator, rspAB operon transcriptional repressor
MSDNRMKTASESSSLAGEAYAAIRERILRGEVAVGQVISRRKIAAEFGMSFLPVSEAFLRLEFEGLLESRPRAGTRVRIPTRQDVEGQYVVREALEVQAAKLFAQAAKCEERAELLKLASRVDSMSRQPDGGRSVFLSLHERLHRRIAECGRCPALCEAIEKTCSLSSIWLCMGRSFPEGHSPRRHQELMEVLVKGDAAKAAEAMRQHIRTSRDWMIERLQPYFSLGDTRGNVYSRSARKNLVPPVHDREIPN